MKLLKLIVVFFIIHYIRRIYQMVKVSQSIPPAPVKSKEFENKDIIDADFKVMN